MSGYAGGYQENGNGSLESLFATARQRNSSATSAPPGPGFASQANPYFASVSSPLPTPPVNNEPPRHASAIMSPAMESPYQRSLVAHNSYAPSNANHTNSLLNLLKFSQGSTSSVNQQSSIMSTRVPSMPASPAPNDLLATLMGKSQVKENPHFTEALRNASEAEEQFTQPSTSGPSADTQAYLLQLLKPQPVQTEAVQSFSNVAGSPAAPNSSQVDTLMAAGVSKEPSLPLTPEPRMSAKPSQGLFTYTNPFDELAASSPRNRTPKPTVPASSNTSTPAVQILKHPRQSGIDNNESKHPTEEHSRTSTAMHPETELDASELRYDDLNAKDAPIAEEEHRETVAEALTELGGQVDKQVEEALARAAQDEQAAIIERDLRDMMDARTQSEFEASAQVAALAIKQELSKKGNEGVLEDSYPKPVVDAVKEIIDNAADGNMPDDWENEGSTVSEDVVKVYNFPMKPFTAISVAPTEQHQLCNFRDGSIFDIARIKKEFDQVDRTLATATANFISYGMSKNGGIRVIRQSDGKDSKLFEETRDRIFNVTISTALGSPRETVIGTGISGTVYWAEVRDESGEDIQDGNISTARFSLPPIQSAGEEITGGMLKTRARKSSTHPEFFAVARGKTIHIIWPAVIMKQSFLKEGKERVVDVKKYLQHQSLKINTGKAGKDFVFSQDDTCVASLDKAGKVKFWDVRTLTNTDRGSDLRVPTPEQIQPVEIEDPIVSLNTTPENEKSWPTSVCFVDKLRPYQKNLALRYLLVGSKQNHSFQLWDLCLLKPVQEVHLPHGKESDAVCSVNYHPVTGILAVGHPTRNSIFFIHLSAPRYDLGKTMSQAELMQKLANKDPSLPSPKSTAVMSGIREYSLASKGQLRSLDMLSNPIAPSEADENPVLFELYAMQSKGVSCLSIKREDMGWNKEHRVIAPKMADEEGMIKVEAISKIEPNVETQALSSRTALPDTSSTKAAITQSSNQSASISKMPEDSIAASSSLSMPKQPKFESVDIAKPDMKREEQTVPSIPIPQDSAPSSNEKAEKKKKKKTAATNTNLGDAAAGHSAAMKDMPNTGMSAAKTNGSKSSETVTNMKDSHVGPAQDDSSAASKMPTLSDATLKSVIKALESSLGGEMDRVLKLSLGELYKRLEDDRRAQAAQGVANQEAVIRLVSSALNENVQKSLGSIVAENVKTMVVPAVSDVVTKAVNDQLGPKLNTQLKTTLPKELQTTLPDAISKTLQKPDLLRSIADALAKSVAFKVEEEFASVLQKSVVPAFTTLATQATQKATAEIQRNASEQIERQSREHNTKVEHLSQLVTGLTETISSMAAAQSKFQAEFLRFQQASGRDRQASQTSQVRPGSSSHSAGTTAVRPQPIARPIAQKSEHEVYVERVLKDITIAMNQGEYEHACMIWLQTEPNSQQELFEMYFSKIDPAFIRGISPLMLLSIGSVATHGIEGQTLIERLTYLDVVLDEVQMVVETMDETMREVTPKIMKILVQRLEHLLVRISAIAPQDPLLKRISNLATHAHRITSIVANQGTILTW